jgi:hypothetical protein
MDRLTAAPDAAQPPNAANWTKAMATKRRNPLGPVDEWARGANGVTRVSITEFDDAIWLNIRRWTRNFAGGKFYPTQKGETIPLDELRRLHRAVGKAIASLEKAGLLPREKA